MGSKGANRIETCNQCLMDSTTIEFRRMEIDGCNFCHEATLARKRTSPRDLENLLERIKSSGKDKEFDCVVGVSGGLDSSYTLYQAISLGLRPLAVHMDNGWGDSLGYRNIVSLTNNLGVKLQTTVTDWEVQRNINKAFLRADVIDLELPYDNALLAVCFSAARQHGIKVIIGGGNKATEGVRIPHDWNWYKHDATNIRSITKAYGASADGYPLYSTLDSFADKYVRRIKWLSLLDHIEEYDKKAAESLLVEQFGYTPYPEKHFENTFTRLYQGLILKDKFGVDKMKAHLSSLIVSGQLDRDEAMLQLTGNRYSETNQCRIDTMFVLDRLDMSQEEFIDYMSRPQRPHSDWNSDLINRFVFPLLRPFRIVLHSLAKSWSRD